jgi:hypothetical protein
LVKHVEVIGDSPLGSLIGDLTAFDPGADVATEVWVTDLYQGNIFEAGPNIEGGGLPTPAADEIVAWPWPSIRPADFTPMVNPSWGRRTFLRDEVAILGLSDNGGVVQRVYLRGPDGRSLYYFSLWPLQPDQRP